MMRIQAGDAETLLGGTQPTDGAVSWSQEFDRPSKASDLFIVPGKHQQPNSERLERHDIVLFGTNIIWEIRNEAGEFFGKAHLQALIREKQYDSAEAICDRIIHTLEYFCGASRQRADVTAVVFHLTA